VLLGDRECERSLEIRLIKGMFEPTFIEAKLEVHKRS
jgi:hypothetical protein